MRLRHLIFASLVATSVVGTAAAQSPVVGVAGFAMHFLADHPLGDLGEVGGQRGTQFFELGPQDLLDEALWRPDYDGLSAHPAIAEGAEAVAATERDEQLSRPHIGDREFDLDLLFLAGGLPKAFCTKRRFSWTSTA